MNLFYLDEDLEKCAQYHIDSHVVKMPLEAAQLLTTTVWVDRLIGYAPRKLSAEELAVIKDFKATQPAIDERTFTRFLPTHPNHPCAIWTRTSLANYEWVFGYCDALNSEWQYRYDHDNDHKAFTAALSLPEPARLPNKGLTERPLCMPADCFDDDPIHAYRLYYMVDKADFAVWKKRQYPPWWDLDFVEYSGKDPHQSYINTTMAPTNRGKPHGQERLYYVRS